MLSLLLIDHGSRLSAANNMLECMANLVQQMAGDGVIVRCAHMELAEPTIEQGFAACVEAGGTEVIAFPYMLSPGRHATGDIPRMVEEAAAAFPGVGWSVTPAFGVHEHLAAVVLERAGVAAAGQPPAEGCCMRSDGRPERFCGEGCREVTSRSASAATPPR
jgi:sirohydrochlorin ferrochelatase